MNTLLKIDKSLNTPVYQQIVDSVRTRIDDKSLSLGDQLPSINQLAGDYNLARETVVKAFKILQEQGIISPVHGKGYFVCSLDFEVQSRIFVLFDTFSAYKEVIYNSLKESTGKNAFIDIYFHHFNFKVFEKLIAEAAGKYHAYIIIPMEHARLEKALESVPADKLYLLDIWPGRAGTAYSGVFQNFENDIFHALESAIGLCRKYSELVLVFRNRVTDPPEGIVTGFKRFCSTYQFNHSVIRTSLSKRKLKKGEGYIIIDDEDLVYLVEQAKTSGLALGSDIGLVSYNETPLKKIAANGISVISTDFEAMGKQIGKMVLKKEKYQLFNPFKYIDRRSF